MDTSTVTSLPEWPLLPPSVVRFPDAGATGPALMVQIVSIDSYMAVPTSVDCLLWAPYTIFDRPLLKVPVIRIFGTTASNQRICLHLHQIWPYIYVQYEGPSNLDAVREFGYHLGLSLNHALNISLRSNGLIFIAAVVPVKGVPFYGYHTGYRPFFKIQLTNPSMMARASSLLSSGAVMGQKMNVLGSHLSYVLQFLVDFNLYGMDWIHLNKILFRSPLPQPAGGSSQMSGAIDDSNVENIYRWVPQGMPSYLARPTPPDRISHCALEADATAADIANRHQVQERHIHHIFQEGKLGLHFGRLVHSLNSMWADENKRRVRHGLGELCPRNSQDQVALEESLLGMPASNDKAADAGADSSKFIRWSNYWRMQSLLQSALAVDKCRLNDKQKSVSQSVLSELETQASCTSTGDIESISSFDFAGETSSWLQCWPTCREVDIGEPRLIGDGGMSRKRFYTDADEGLALSEQSGLVDATSSTTQPMTVSLTDSTNDGHLTPRATQSVRPAIIIDLLLIDSNDSKGGASTESEDEQGFESYESAQPVVDLGTVSADNDLLDDFADFDDGWVENEVFRAEGGQTKDLYKYIPQTDGSNDFESGSKRKNVIGENIYIDIVVPPTSFALRLQHQQDQVLCYGSTVGVEQPAHMRSNSSYYKAVDSGKNVDFALQLCAADYNQSGYFVYAYHAPRWDTLVNSMVEHAMAEVVAPQPRFSEARDLPRTRKMYSGHTQASTLQTLEMAAGRKPFMSQMSVEILTSCREEALPNPMVDSVLCVIACYICDKPQWSEDTFSGCASVVWTWGPLLQIGRLSFPRHVEQQHHANEASMLRELAKWTRAMDPDILCGFEVQGSSWGYLADRAEHAFDIELESELSRIVTRQNSWQHSHNKSEGRGQGSWSQRKGTALNVVGRHVLNVWRLMRSELSLTSYTFEKIVQKVLGEQSPHYPPHQLAAWFTSGPAVTQIRALRHVHFRARAALRILDQTGVVARASEFASVIGIDFAAVFMRGSQLRVESLMARIAHPELFVLASPTREQVAQQRAAECLPLVLEPQSKYYTDPVVVLDFQSLYPSIMIAYNYCFSTCLGSVGEAAAVHSDTGDTQRRRLGFSSVDVPPGMLTVLKDYLTVSPNGMLFVKPSVRQGLLGRMLHELLESRVMVNDAMKRWGDGDEALLKKLDAWQLGLKLITNVTYGYAGASFSGRMPCVEIADAIVQSGRETLESAIRLIHSKHSTWGARVVYGDTDSIFIHLPGKSRESAFIIGNEIAEAVTELNPAPVKLKFEKVYQPCVLLTKKRYAGWMFTTPEQREPLLDVKGMELVRRDGCSATQKILEGTIDVLFRTNDLSLVKSFVTGELTKVLRGDMPLHEFVIAKEVRLGTYSKSTLPAHAKVAADGIKADARAEPKFGERVPYVVVSKGRDSRLTDQVVGPQILLRQPELRLDYQYYIDRQIVPALDRVLSLVGVNVRMWATEMPRRLRSSLYDAVADTHSDSDSEAGGGTISELHNQQGIQELDGINGYAHGRHSNIGRAFGLRGFGMTRIEKWTHAPHNIKRIELQQSLLGHDGCVNALCWSLDGRYLFSGSDDSTICVWRAAGDGSRIGKLRTGFNERVFDLKVMPVPNDHLLVACSMDYTIKVFDIGRILSRADAASTHATTSRPTLSDTLEVGDCCVRTFAVHSAPVKRIAVMYDQPHEFLSCSEDGTARHFDLREPLPAPAPALRHRHAASTRGGHIVADYQTLHAELHALDTNPFQSSIFAVGGSITSIMVHDRRMPQLGSAHDIQRNYYSNWSGDRCIVRLRRNASPSEDDVFERISDNMVTGLRFSRDTPNQVIGSWCYDYVYLFDLNLS
ncbi:DNA polymerase zeta, partial [Kickxella alabastrina]